MRQQNYSSVMRSKANEVEKSGMSGVKIKSSEEWEGVRQRIVK